jgi:hypothetical protein
VKLLSAKDGWFEGRREGDIDEVTGTVELNVGALEVESADGVLVGSPVGSPVGTEIGYREGICVGSGEGWSRLLNVGSLVGSDEGSPDGADKVLKPIVIDKLSAQVVEMKRNNRANIVKRWFLLVFTQGLNDNGLILDWFHAEQRVNT